MHNLDNTNQMTAETDTHPADTDQPLPDASAETQTQEAESPKTSDVPPAREETDWKAQARKWESRAKANSAAAKQLEAVSEDLKTKDADLEALRAKVSAFEHDREVAGWRDQVAADTGVPAGLLRGDTLEDLQAHAEAIAAAYPKTGAAPVVFHAGNPTQPGPLSIDEQIASAQAAGDKQLVRSLKAMKLATN